MWSGENGNGSTKLRVYVNGIRHKVWVNDTKVIDTIDSQKTSCGYVGLFCDSANIVYWDNFNVASSLPVPQKTPVLRYFDVSSAAAGLANAKRYDIYHTVSCIQGLANRQAPRLFVRYAEYDPGEVLTISPDGNVWMGRLIESGGLCEDWPVINVKNISDLIDTYRDYINGVIVYDDTTGVLSTSLAATTAAGCENAIAVRKDTASDSIYTYLTVTKGLPVLIDLSSKFTGSGIIWDTNTASTRSAKCDAYIWAKEKYLDTGRCNPTVLSYTLDEYGLKINNVDLGSQLCNLDYAVSKKGFCFDLSPWGDERPNDDLTQPLGTDRNTFRAILAACNTQTGQSKMIQFLGFTRWDCKYTSYGGFGSHTNVDTEWETVELLSAYNAYMEATAPNPMWVMNTSLYSSLKPALNQRRYVQNPAPTYDNMVARNLITATGTVPNGNYMLMGLGDFDGPAWPLAYLGYDLYADPVRGQIYCNWGIDPNIVDTASVAFDYLYRNKTDKDFFVCWDSGAGYVDPTKLYGTRSPSGYSSIVGTWQKHCRDYYRMFDYSITGWVFPAASTMSTTDYLNFAPFSGDGIGGSKVLPSVSNSLLVDGNVPCKKLDYLLGGDTARALMNNSSGVNFAMYQTSLWTPTQLQARQNQYTNYNHQFLDAYSYFYLLRYFISGNDQSSNYYRATWVGDTIPRVMAKGHTYPATVTVRNDGWDTWTAADRYSLGYAIVSSGAAVTNSNYDANGRIQVPSGITVAPGQSVTFTVNVNAPSTNGNYDLYYDMVKDGATWFHDANNIEWKKQIIVATNETDVDTDGDGVADVTEDANGTLYWHPDDGTVPVQPVDVAGIVDAKSQADGTTVAITNGMVVTAVFDGAFYIEETNRQSGIKVVSNDTVALGTKVTVTGILETVNGERQITATTAPVVAGPGTVLPLGITNKAIGGLDISNGSGLGNVGLLMKVWGKVVDSSNPGYILIDDGSGLNIKVDLSYANKPLSGGTTFVTITGICSAEETSGVVTPVIIPRSNADVSW
ncbi:hypothetical protein LLG39_05805 [bacterium]|nr:hypothetical protein [bacterium]